MLTQRIAVSFALAAGLWIYAATSFAVTSNPACVASAINARKDCALACQAQFQVDKDTCLNVNHECADTCRTGRNACFDIPLSELRSCIQAANDALDAAINAPVTGCRALHPSGTPELGACIDQAQVIAFQARD